MNVLGKVLALCFMVGLAVIGFRIVCVGAATIWRCLPAIGIGLAVYWLFKKVR